MRAYCAEIAVVCGDGASDAKTVWGDVADKVIVSSCLPGGHERWRTGLAAYGADKLKAFDAVILLDDHCMGPVFAPDDLFARMTESGMDFWGLSDCCDGEKDSRSVLWPHFLAAGGEVLAEWCRRTDWRTPQRRGEITTGIALGEELEALGFRRSVAFPGGTEHSKDPMLFSPVEILTQQHIPFFSRDVFCAPYDELVAYSTARQGKSLMEHLQRNTDYDTDPLWEYLLATQHMYDLGRSLALYRILPTDRCEAREERRNSSSVALVIHMHYEECISYCYRYACSMPEDADIYLTATSETLKNKLEQVFGQSFGDRMEIRVIENRGRDVSALLVACRDLFERYEILCFAHDKKAHGREYGIVGEGFAEHCFQNVLATSCYVRNILARFDAEPRLGLLCPPPPFHANHYELIGNEWTVNYPTVKRLAEEFEVRAPMDSSIPPVAPLGTIFWFRTDALRPLAERNWSYSDFPPEPNGLDGTLLHGLERLYPYVAQQSGYYSAWTATTEYAQRYTHDLVYKLRSARWQYSEGSVGRFILLRVKDYFKKRLPESVWKCLKRFWLILKKR